MMIGPILKGGLQDTSFNGEIVSATYIEMTLELMTDSAAQTSVSTAIILKGISISRQGPMPFG
jgi:5-enolpyruvylshikimate-3-phosphate synthase